MFCVCVCVCVREREREREKEVGYANNYVIGKYVVDKEIIDVLNYV